MLEIAPQRALRCSVIRAVHALVPERLSQPDPLRDSMVRHYTAALREPYYLWHLWRWPDGRYACEGQAVNLVKMTLPDAPTIVRRYHHEDQRHSHALTDISAEPADSEGKPPTSQRL